MPILLLTGIQNSVFILHGKFIQLSLLRYFFTSKNSHSGLICSVKQVCTLQKQSFESQKTDVRRVALYAGADPGGDGGDPSPEPNKLIT